MRKPPAYYVEMYTIIEEYVEQVRHREVKLFEWLLVQVPQLMLPSTSSGLLADELGDRGVLVAEKVW